MAENVERTPEEIRASVLKAEAEAVKLQHEAAYFEQQARFEAARAEGAELDLHVKRRVATHLEAERKHNRIYDFTQLVKAESVEPCMQTLAQWAHLSTAPITVCFHSPGGSVFDGLRLYDYIRTLVADGIEVTTVTLGMAASMAGILLEAGSRRVVGPEAWVLIHEVSTGALGSVSEIEDEAKFARRLNKRLAKILAARSKLSQATIETRAKRRDWWLDSQEVLKAGLADEAGYR